MAVAVSRYRSSKCLTPLSVLLLGWSMFGVPDSQAQHRSDLKGIVQSLVVVERQAALEKLPFLYTSIENPNSDYIPQTYEERALHGMSGTYGLLGTIHRGSDFTATRDMIAPGVWKTTFLDVHIDGRIAILKTISRSQHSIHQGFYPLPVDVTLPQAAAPLTR
jgi:hypothetical protein